MKFALTFDTKTNDANCASTSDILQAVARAVEAGNLSGYIRDDGVNAVGYWDMTPTPTVVEE